MAWSRKNYLKHLGALRGEGRLRRDADGEDFGPVTYEIDGYAERGMRVGLGQIEGRADVLALARAARGLVLQIDDGRILEVAMGNPEANGTAAEIRLTHGFPAAATSLPLPYAASPAAEAPSAIHRSRLGALES